MSLTIVRITERPDLLPLVARWLWQAFGRSEGGTLAESEARVAACTAETGPGQSFVLLRDGEPIGTAGFVAHDLDARPDLTPWLAGVYVVPQARGQGHVRVLIPAVEAAARSAGADTLWLYTSKAERIYARAGWTTAERFEASEGSFAVIMRRDLGATTSRPAAEA